jgi:hypothetical protein
MLKFLAIISLIVACGLARTQEYAFREYSLKQGLPQSQVMAINQENYHWANRHCGYVSGPDDAAPHPDYMPAIWYLNV